MKVLLAALSLAIVGLNVTAQETAPAPVAPAVEKLQVGSAAPAVKFSQFYKGTGLDALAADQTYIVEFWATWCGPCVAAFPHLSEIATATAGKVTVIGVNVWERLKPEQVQAFVDKQGSKMSYNVAADAEDFMVQNWLQAAGQNGIPCAFIVLKGKIAWIGHPGALDHESVLGLYEGTLTAADMAKRDELRKALQQEISSKVYAKSKANDFKGALAAAQEMSEANPEAAKMLKNIISEFAFIVLVDENPAEAINQTLTADADKFFRQALRLSNKTKLSAEDAMALDKTASEHLAKIPADEIAMQLAGAMLKADLLANRGDLTAAIASLEAAKTTLDPKLSPRFTHKIEEYKARAATASANAPSTAAP